jgi:peptide/nickel transport system substrate-binding protein
VNLTHPPRGSAHGRRRRSLALCAAAAAPVVLAAACSSSGSSSGATPGSSAADTLTWALPAPPTSLDMFSDFSTTSDTVINLISDGLVSLNDLKLQPDLATSWKAVSPTKYVYTLRQNVKFSDGKPVTTADVIYSLERNTGPKTESQTASHLSHLKSIYASGPGQVTMTLTQPDSTWPYDPLFAPIVEKSLAESEGSKYGAPGTKIVGTGPYMVKSFSASTGITLVRNPYYWGKKPPIKTITFSYISDPQTLALAMRSGEIDGTFAIPTDSAKQFTGLPDTSMITAPGLSVASLSFDMSEKPWNDIHVRKAFAYAWDAPVFTSSVLHGYASPAVAVEEPQDWTSVASPAQVSQYYAQIPTYPYSLAKARQELKESSDPNGFSASISYPQTDPDLGEALQALAQNLSQIGIKLAVHEIPEQQWLSVITGHKNLGLEVVTWYPDYPDPSDLILSQYPSSHAIPNQYNLANFKDPAVDNLINQELASTSKTVRAKDMAEVMKIVGAQAPDLYLYWPKTIMAIRKPFGYTGYDGFYDAEQWIWNVTT